MASSSAHHRQHRHHVLPNLQGGATAAPPPTPCSQPNNGHEPTTSTEADADALSRLLHRLPPALSLPTRRSPRATASLPAISMSAGEKSGDLLSAATEFGYFQLTDTGIPSGLANSAESVSLSLFELAEEQKNEWFPKAWPLGYEAGDEEEAETPSFCLDADCSTESSELSLSSLREFTRGLEKAALEVVEMLARAIGFENPFGFDPTRRCTLMWVHKSVHGDKPVVSGGFYPFVVGLQYQIRNQKYSLLADSGWVSVSPRVDSVLVTLGDVAQVWSNGKLKRVRGRPVACSGEGDEPNKLLTMTLLLTLPADSKVSPLLPRKLAEEETPESGDIEDEEGDAEQEEGGGGGGGEGAGRRVFRSFPFEDYAWRVYHERLLFNRDPLDKYRVRSLEGRVSNAESVL